MRISPMGWQIFPSVASDTPISPGHPGPGTPSPDNNTTNQDTEWNRRKEGTQFYLSSKSSPHLHILHIEFHMKWWEEKILRQTKKKFYKITWLRGELLFDGWFPSGMMKKFWRWMMVMVPQQCQCLCNHWTVLFKMVKMVKNYITYI